MEEIKAPNKYNLDKFTIFLAGSIEMGKAKPWQKEVTDSFKNNDVTILNPRRTDWDSSQEQSIENEYFKEQVVWELEAQDKSDLILMHFDEETKSPITLLELGLFKDKEMIVCCPDGFWRKGNVDVVCERYKITQVDTLEEMIDLTKMKFLNKDKK